MTLHDFLRERGESAREFAARKGFAYTTIRKIAYRQRQPSLALAVLISKATGGRVSPREMVLDPIEPEPIEPEP